MNRSGGTFQTMSFTNPCEPDDDVFRPPVEDPSAAVARGHAELLDLHLRTAITNHLGGAWALPDLKGRLACVTTPGSEIETYTLDGVAIFQTGPITTEWENRGRTFSMKVLRGYRILNEPETT